MTALATRSLAGRLMALVAAAFALALSLLTPAAAHADEVTASNVSASTEDPTSLTFHTRVTAPAGLEEAEVIFRVLNPKEGDVGGSGTATFGPGPENDVSFTLQTITAQRYIPVGSIFRYHWEFTDSEGDTLVTDEQEYIFLDGRFPWVSKESGAVTVYYYGTNEGLADGVLAAIEASINDAEALLGVEVPYPVRVMVWASEDDGELATRPRSAAFEELISTGGQRVAPDLLFVFAATADVVRHEATHIVTAVAGDGPFSSAPSWLDEGTAVYMQNSRLAYGSAIELGIATDRTLRLRNMESASNNPSEVTLFYGQSFSTVEFLIDEFGREKFAELFRVIREGARTDDALEQVYGVDQDGLYNLWREANGLDPMDFGPRVEATAAPPAEATRPPLAIPTGVSSAGDDDDADDDDDAPAETAAPESTAAVAGLVEDDDGGSNLVAGIIVGVIALALAGGLGGAAFWLSRRPRPA